MGVERWVLSLQGMHHVLSHGQDLRPAGEGVTLQEVQLQRKLVGTVIST